MNINVSADVFIHDDDEGDGTSQVVVDRQSDGDFIIYLERCSIFIPSGEAGFGRFLGSLKTGFEKAKEVKTEESRYEEVEANVE